MLRLLGTLTGVDLAVKSPPFLRELLLGGNVLEGDGEMDEIKVEVLETPELKGLLAALLDLSS